MKRILKSFLLMLLFLTRIPLSYPYKYEDEDFIRGIKLTPIIGLVIGIFISIPFLAVNYLDKPVLILIVWSLYIWITGGLHIDGLTDTIDGIFSNRDKKQVLEIMSDSRIGAFGVIGFVMMILFNVTLSMYISYEFFIILPIVGRTCSLLSASISSYAKESFGMGTHYVDNARLRDVIMGNMLVLVLILVLKLNLIFMISVITTQIVVLFLTEYIKKKIDGMTGDTIGFILEISQTIFLFASYIIIKII